MTALIMTLLAAFFVACVDDYPPCAPEENGKWGPGGPIDGPIFPSPSTGPGSPGAPGITYSTTEGGEVCECGPYASGCEETPERAKMAAACRPLPDGRRTCLAGFDPGEAAVPVRDWFCNVAKTRVATGERRTWTLKVWATDEPGAIAEAYAQESSDPRYSHVVVERCWRELPN